MVFSGMLRRVVLVRTDVTEEPGASFLRVTRLGELGTKQAATSNRRTLRRNTTRRNIPEDTILHSHRRENLKSYENCIYPMKMTRLLYMPSPGTLTRRRITWSVL
jgi:hypothetical protein